MVILVLGKIYKLILCPKYSLTWYSIYGRIVYRRGRKVPKKIPGLGGYMDTPTYDPKAARCVSHRDLYNMFSEDGPTRANMLCLIDCLRYGFHEKDTRRAPMRTAPGAVPATHDSVVEEVLNRIGPAIEAAMLRAAGATETPAPSTGGGNGGEGLAGGNGGNGGDAIAEPPTIPAGYGNPNYVGRSEVHGAADEVDPADFADMPLAKDSVNIEPEALPVPLTADELAKLRAKLAED